MKKVELLAPAGNYEAFLGAIHAGADAVYLGGTQYSARAFADNFDEDTLCRAISYAHLLGRKVYLTMNTLVKQQELEKVYSFLKPFYLEGLDGVIVQDIGLLSYIREHFPLLDVHISTQMAITGPYGARVLKELGATRVVPARELSLEEMKRIKEEGLEVETFVHGAMCYCYSGQCFFSSMLGGRSGNRGKCAQSCRLPYQIKLSQEKKKEKKSFPQKEEYPLSLKDMCSIEHLPQLIEAGIDSFKIEGRMKRPEYAAGVTAIYRKYIDQYYAAGCQSLNIEEEDWKKLKSLYIRSDIQDGYYYRHNGPEMVTLHKPSYLGTDDILVENIRKEYIETALKAPVKGRVSLRKGEPLTLTLKYHCHTITTQGPVVEQAVKKAVSHEDVEKQLKKTGNTHFYFTCLEIDMDEDSFLPLKALNELRRTAFALLEAKLTEGIKAERAESLLNTDHQNTSLQTEERIKAASEKEDFLPKTFLITLTTREQCLKACTLSPALPLFVASDLLLGKNREEIGEALRKRAVQGGQVWLKLPEVFRHKDIHFMEHLLQDTQDFLTGMLISNMETYGYLKANAYKGKIALNHHMYIWNQESMAFWSKKAESFLAPLECNRRRWEKLTDTRFSYLVYGRIPMMVTANCIRKTGLHCQKTEVSLEESLRDRYGADFPVQVNCNYCYNVIYNSVPLSLHGYLDSIKALPGSCLRLDFTIESPAEMEAIIREYEKALEGRAYDFSFLKEYTTGHYKKGAL